MSAHGKNNQLFLALGAPGKWDLSLASDQILLPSITDCRQFPWNSVEVQLLFFIGRRSVFDMLAFTAQVITMSFSRIHVQA